MRISDWSSDVCSSDLDPAHAEVESDGPAGADGPQGPYGEAEDAAQHSDHGDEEQHREQQPPEVDAGDVGAAPDRDAPLAEPAVGHHGGPREPALPRHQRQPGAPGGPVPVRPRPSRAEERRVGKEGGTTWISQWAP